MNICFPKEEYEAPWARVEWSMIDRAYDVAVAWSRSGGTFDHCEVFSNFYISLTMYPLNRGKTS